MDNQVKITLRAARVNAGLNQTTAADLLRIGISTLQGYENGRRIPRWDIMQRMEQVYGIESRYLILPDEY